MDKITISDLEVFYRVGVPAAERAQPQRLLITVEMEADFTAAAAKDDLGATIDYFAVYQRLRAFGQGREWKLIETLSMEILETIWREFKPRRIRVVVKKFILPGTAFVSVETVR